MTSFTTYDKALRFTLATQCTFGWSYTAIQDQSQNVLSLVMEEASSISTRVAWDRILVHRCVLVVGDPSALKTTYNLRRSLTPRPTVEYERALQLLDLLRAISGATVLHRTCDEARELLLSAEDGCSSFSASDSMSLFWCVQERARR